jgi:hypothetical protein
MTQFAVAPSGETVRRSVVGRIEPVTRILRRVTGQLDPHAAIGPPEAPAEMPMALPLLSGPNLTTLAAVRGREGGIELKICRVVAAIGAVALTLAFAGSARAVEDAGSPYDFASGGGQTAAGEQFGLTAHDGPKGPSGYVTYQTAAFDVGGAVTCINAGAGRLATIGILIERSSDPSLIGQGFLLYVEDGDAIDATRPDRVTYALVDRSATRRCTARRLTPFQTVTNGNIIVEDSHDVDPVEEPGATA